MGSDPALLAALAAGLQASLHIEHASNGTGSLIDPVAMAGVLGTNPRPGVSVLSVDLTSFGR